MRPSPSPLPSHTRGQRASGRRYWLSWVQETEDYRPLHYPPKPEAIIGWWCSGFTSDGGATLCALVRASSVRAAKRAILAEWPEAPSLSAEWRIEDEKPGDWLPGDRFPLDDQWMRDRA